MRAKEPNNPDSSKPKLSSSKTHSFPNSKNTHTHKQTLLCHQKATNSENLRREGNRKREREKREEEDNGAKLLQVPSSSSFFFFFFFNTLKAPFLTRH
jgi:hypothetical protein